MELNKYVLPLLLILTGCSSMSMHQTQIYEQGYRHGVKEQIDRIAAQFQGGNFPYYHWAAPIVQEVEIPSHIENGLFIPKHRELVLIKPGEWMKDPGYPIDNQENNTHEQNNGNAVSDITFLPKSSIKPSSSAQ